MKKKLLLLIIMFFTTIILLAGCGTNSSENTGSGSEERYI